MKQCANRGCSLHGMSIDPGDKTDCISCGRPLSSGSVQDLFADIVGSVDERKKERQEDFLGMVQDEIKKRQK